MKDELAIKYFNIGFFWDCDASKIKIRKHDSGVIERVLSQSLNLDRDLEILDQLYTRKEIQKIALSSTQIFGNECIEKIAKRYDLNLKQFDKYIR